MEKLKFMGPAEVLAPTLQRNRCTPQLSVPEFGSKIYHEQQESKVPGKDDLERGKDEEAP